MKLPDIQFSSASAVQLAGPAEEVAKSNQRVDLVNQAIAGANQIADTQRKFVLAEVEAGYSRELSEFRQKTDKVDTINAGEALAINEEFGLNLDIENRDYINKAEWYPLVLEKKMKEIRSKYTAKIASPIDRNTFGNVMSQNENRILESEISMAAQQTRQAIAEEEKAKIDMAVESNDFLGAKNMINASSIYQGKPEAKAGALHKLNIEEKKADFNIQLMGASTIEDFNSILNTVTSSEWNEGIPSDDVLRMAGSVITQRNSAIALAKQARTDSQDAAAMDMLIGITSGQATLADVNENAQVLGRANHARLVGAARTVATSGMVSDPAYMRSVTYSMVGLEAGFYDGSFDDAVRELQSSVLTALESTDPITGEKVQSISFQDAAKLGSALSSLKDFPYKTEEYSAIQSELSDRILGAPDSQFAFIATEESRQLRADALNSLRKYVEANGGVAADLSLWKRDYMPLFLSDAARVQILGMSKDVKSYVVTGKSSGIFSVDIPASRQKFIDKQKEIFIKSERGEDMTTAQGSLDRAMSEFESWLDTNEVNNGN